MGCGLAMAHIVVDTAEQAKRIQPRWEMAVAKRLQPHQVMHMVAGDWEMAVAHIVVDTVELVKQLQLRQVMHTVAGDWVKQLRPMATVDTVAVAKRLQPHQVMHMVAGDWVKELHQMVGLEFALAMGQTAVVIYPNVLSCERHHPCI